MPSLPDSRGFEIVVRQDFSDVTYLHEVRDPLMARPDGIKPMVSLDPIMMDGAGIKFAGVDGPDFDGLMVRLKRFATVEKAASHCFEESCRIGRSAGR
jgi:hypothetical protein